MKLRTISNILNVRNTVESLTDAIMAGEAWLVLDSEIGNIPVEITDHRVHKAQDPNFGVFVCRFREAPFTTFVRDIIRSGNHEKYRWYVNIPYVEGQSREFTRDLVIRAIMTVFLGEVVEDSAYRFEEIGPNTIDSACAIYRINFLKDECYNYQSFNRELCKLSVGPMQRVGQNYRSFLLSNRELLRVREQLARSREVSSRSDFFLHHDDSREMSFGGRFYLSVFALVVEDLHISFHNNLGDTYTYVTSEKANPEDDCLPIQLMKICLLDKPLGRKKGDN